MSIRMRHTRGHTGNRRSHHALKQMNVIVGEEGNRLPHRLDESTGMYRGKQIAPVREAKAAAPKAKGPDTEPKEHAHEHDHAHVEHANADTKVSKGVAGKLAAGGRPKARSGMGGGA